MKLLFSVCVLSHALQPLPIYRSSGNSTVTADPSRQLAAPLYCSFRSQAGLSPAQRTQAAANTDAQFVSQSDFGRRKRGSRCPCASATPHSGSVAAVTLSWSQAPVCLQVNVSICRLQLASARPPFCRTDGGGKRGGGGGKRLLPGNRRQRVIR